TLLLPHFAIFAFLISICTTRSSLYEFGHLEVNCCFSLLSRFRSFLSPSTLSPSLSGFVLLVYFVGVLFGFREFGGKMQKRKGYSQFKLLSLAEFEVINYVGTPA
ncbi:hypothetical protein TorRG33x02_210120, partial [Trema orientale]